MNQVNQLSIILLALFLWACNTPTNTGEKFEGEETAIMNVDVLPMNGSSSILKNQNVLIRDGKIYQMGPSEEVKPSKDAKTIDGSGKYLMPGLAEMHAHIPVAQDGNDTLVKETLLLYLTQGVTTIRGMLGNPYHLELKKMVANEEILSPRVYTSSPSMNGNSVPSAEVAEEKVRQYKEDGYDFLKIHPGIKLEAMQQLVSTAKEVGIVFSGHIPADVGIRNAIDFGYGTIDHLDGYVTGMATEGANADEGGFFGMNFTDEANEERMLELVRKTKAKGIAVIPTQTLFTRWISPKPAAEMVNEPEIQYMPARTRFAWRTNKERMLSDPNYSPELQARFVSLRQKLLKALHDEGVEILLGSDAPQVFNVPGFSILHEMEDMADAGLPNEFILKSGTEAPARFFNAQGQYGTVEEGAAADLILLDANPLDDISNIRKQSGVMVRGKWLSNTFITEALAKIAKRNAS